MDRGSPDPHSRTLITGDAKMLPTAHPSSRPGKCSQQLLHTSAGTNTQAHRLLPKRGICWRPVMIFLLIEYNE